MFYQICQHVEAVRVDEALFRGSSLQPAVGLEFGAWMKVMLLADFP